MVMLRRPLAFLLPLYIFFFFSVYADVTVTVRINDESSTVDRPIEGMINISHDGEEEIDIGTFFLEGKPLTVEFLNDSYQSSVSIINGKRSESNTTNSRYRFFIPPQDIGAHTLMPISVVIGGEKHRSSAISYVIADVASDESFRLQASLEGPERLYPGQSATFVYRIFSKDPVEITYEYFPFLDAEGFRNTGAHRIRAYSNGGYNVKEILQDVEATKPGEHAFEPSVIEGKSYRQDFFGRKTYLGAPLRAATPAMTITVADFPEKGRPPSFSGAIGEYTATITMVTPEEVHVGDKIVVEVSFVGDGPLSTVQFPEIRQLPEFQRAFRISDLPPDIKTEGNKKTFKIELRPLSSDVSFIPSIEISSFSPTKERYITQTLGLLPITVLPISISSDIATAIIDDDDDIYTPGLIVLAGNEILSDKQLSSSPFENNSILWLAPFAFIVIIFQAVMRNIMKKKKSQGIGSTELFYHALAVKNEEQKFFAALEKAFILRLQEQGHHIDGGTFSHLPREGRCGAVRLFFEGIDERRFLKKEGVDINDVIKQARHIFFEDSI